MERYEKNINLIKKHNLSVSLLNLDGTIPYADGCIDKIINIETNVCCERDEKLINECYRIMRPKTGRFIFTTIDVSNRMKAYPLKLFYDVPTKNLVAIEKTMDIICENKMDAAYSVEDITQDSLFSLIKYLYASSKFAKKTDVSHYIQKIMNIKYFIVLCNKID